MIVEGHELHAPVALRTHTLVIGSGAGGAVVAHGLAMAGVETIVVEEGGYFRAHDMTQRDDQMLPALYRERGQQLSSDGMINVLQGSCFGGSTVINTADCEATPEPVYQHWRRRYELDLDARELADAQARVFEMLDVRPIDASQVNRNNAVVLEGARKLGWKAGTFLNNRSGRPLIEAYISVIRDLMMDKREDEPVLAGLCKRCGTSLDKKGYCGDETCPHSDHLQDETWVEG